jgi:SAM-dependent methyltransferase
MNANPAESDQEMSEYRLANGWELARRRLHALEKAYDPLTIRRLDTLGVEPGWTCLEVGAGAGSITRWLARRVGPDGRVVATDIDVSLLDEVGQDNVDVRELDLRDADLPEAAFALIHSRFVLGHIVGREHILDKLVRSLRPGGWLVVEEADQFATGAIDDGLHAEVMKAHWAAMSAAGFAGTYGRELPTLLVEHGLSQVDAVCEVPFDEGGSPELEWLQLTFDQMGGPQGGNVLDPGTMRRWRELTGRPGRWFNGISIVSVRGRRPR